MDSYNYPDSGSSSPRSRDIDPSDSSSSFFDDSAAQQLLPSSNYKLKFMVSYGGKIQPRLHDNHLTYLGGETKLLTVDRHISLPSLLSRLSSLSPDIPSPVSSFKYQLPGEDLDSLISVSSEDDLLHLFLEYDRLLRSSTSSKPPRMRLFLFPLLSSSSTQQPPLPSPECDRFIDALNSVPSAPQDPHKDDARSGRGSDGVPNSMNFLLGFEKGMLGAGFRKDPVLSEREVADDRGLNPVEVQRQLQRMQLHGDSQDSITTYGREMEESMNVDGGIGGYGLPIDFYARKITERTAPPAVPLQQAMPAPAAALAGYWQEKQAPSVGFLATGVPEQQMYVIPGHPAGGIHNPPPPQAQMVRPVGSETGHGYYAVTQRFPPEIYREHPPPPPQQQQLYSILPQQAWSVGQPPSFQSQAEFTKAGENVGMVRTSAAWGGVVDAMNYGQGTYVATAGGRMMVPSPYKGMGAVSGPDTRLGGGSGGLIQEGEVVGKVTQNQNSI